MSVPRCFFLCTRHIHPPAPARLPRPGRQKHAQSVPRFHPYPVFYLGPYPNLAAPPPCTMLHLRLSTNPPPSPRTPPPPPPTATTLSSAQYPRCSAGPCDGDTLSGARVRSRSTRDPVGLRKKEVHATNQKNPGRSRTIANGLLRQDHEVITSTNSVVQKGSCTSVPSKWQRQSMRSSSTYLHCFR